MKKHLSLIAPLALAAYPISAKITFIEITDDTNSGISSEMTFTHAIDFGASGTANVNGVIFANDVNIAADGRNNAGNRTYGPNNHPGNAPPAVTGGVESLFRDMRYNGPDPSYVELTGLTPGEWYDLRLYERAWDFMGSTRTYSVNYDIDADNSVEFSTTKINQNDSTLPDPGFASNASYALSYKYQAGPNGSIRVNIDLADDQNGTYHLYGITNAVNPDGGSSYLFSIDNNTFSSGDSQGSPISSLAGSFGGNPDQSTFTLVAGQGDTDNEKFQVNDGRLELGDFDFSGNNSIDGQNFTVRIQGTGSGIQERAIILTILKDDDSDNLLDDWENNWAGNLNDLTAELGNEDFDGDGLTNLEEFRISRGTYGESVPAYSEIDPTKKDSDGDTLDDAEEISPTGTRPQTNPTSVDTDSDGLSDAVETNSGIFIDANNAGSNPTLCDSDGDFATDFWEITHNSNPSDANSRPAPNGAVAIVSITDDASTGLDLSKTYTHLVSGGQSATVNGVNFDALDVAFSPADFIWETAPRTMNQVLNNNGDWDALSAGVSPNVENLLASFTYSGTGPNPGNSQIFTLSNLTPGASYDLRIYSRAWDTEGSGRPIDLVFTNGDQTVQPFGSMALDRPGFLTGSGFNNDAYYLTFQYTAQTTELVINAAVPVCAPGNSGSFHLYALSNEIATGVPLGQILITNHTLLPDGRYAIGFKAKSQTTYKVTKSANLEGDFLPLDPPLSVTTDVNGDGQALIPSIETTELKEFFRIEE